jgi:hypothetical protein
MNCIYESERDFSFSFLSKEAMEVASAIEEERVNNGCSDRYRALCRTFLDMNKRYLALLKEQKTEQASGDALTAFNAPSVYDERGVLFV